MRWRVLAVATLFVLAGCGSVFAGSDASGDAGDEEAFTPAPVPEVTPTPERWPVAPGLSGAGVVDVDVLVRNHLDAIEGQSYVWREWQGIERAPRDRPGADDAGASGDETVTDDAAAATDTARNRTGPSLVRRVRVAGENRYVYWAESELVYLDGGTWYRYNYTEYVLDGVGYTRLPSADPDLDGPVRFRAATATERAGSMAGWAVGQYLDRSPARTSVARTRHDDRLFYRVEARGVDLTGVAGDGNFTVTALVSPDGFVRSLTVRHPPTARDPDGWVRYRFRYDRVGDTRVDLPRWVDREAASGDR